MKSDKQCVICSLKGHTHKEHAEWVKSQQPRMKRANTGYKLSNSDFDKFITLCEDKNPISNKIKAAVNRLDTEGYKVKK